MRGRGLGATPDLQSNTSVFSKYRMTYRILRICLLCNSRHFRVNMKWMGYHAENPISEFHDADGVFEAFMGSPRIDQICQSQLVNGTQPLERTRIYNISFVGIEISKNVNRVA